MLHLEDICESISSSTGVAPVTVRFVARKLFAEIRATMQRQEEVYIPDFGRFDFRQRKALISHNVNGGPSTYTPQNSSLHFTPDVKWASWQRVHSAVIPDELPPGTQLGARLTLSSHIRQQMGDAAPPLPERDAKSQSFYENLILKRAEKKYK